MASNGPFRVLLDGACPICRQEGYFLQWADLGRGRILIDDIASPGFDPGRYGLTHQQVMGQIHGITSDGRVLRGLEVFREAYSAIGLGWIMAPTGWPMFRPFFDLAYKWFARNRLRITGQGSACDSHRCRSA